MNKQTIIGEVEEVINILKAELVKADSFIKEYDSMLSTYEEAHDKIMNDPEYEGDDLAGITKEYMDRVTEEKANNDLVEALWKVESLLRVMNR